MNRKDEIYEFEERAAIREFDGRFGRGRAERLAATDIQERRFYQGKVGRPPLQRSSDAAELRRQRDEVGRRMRATTDREQKDELFRQWQELTSKIIDLRKES